MRKWLELSPGTKQNKSLDLLRISNQRFYFNQIGKYLENLLNKNKGRMFVQQENKNNKDDKRKINKTVKSSF